METELEVTVDEDGAYKVNTQPDLTETEFGAVVAAILQHGIDHCEMRPAVVMQAMMAMANNAGEEA